MAFCSFSKDFNENGFTVINNRFLTKFLPEADGFAVKVYLYGLYLCKLPTEFSITSLAEVLHSTEQEIKNAFSFWQDYDLVEVMSESPYAVNYLPIESASGKPKKIRYERYGDFNKELQHQMQLVGKFLSYNDLIKFMQFLDTNEIQPNAFLLISEYCIRKQGEKVSNVYIFNKAKKFIANGFLTYEQVEKELSTYNTSEGDVIALFTMLAINKKPDETDFDTYASWLNLGFTRETVLAVAKALPHATMNSLNATLQELAKLNKLSKDEAESYLELKDTLSDLTFKVAKKIGVKIGNPMAYIEEYTKKWYEHGYEEASLLPIAQYCLKTDKNDFANMDTLLDTLYKQGIVSQESVDEYLAVKNNELKTFTEIQKYTGTLKKSDANLSLIETWHSWNFNDEMILEAGKRAQSVTAPVPYMNKILSDWKRLNVFTPKDIPEKTPTSYVSPTVKQIDEKTDREKYYTNLHENAVRLANKYQAKALAYPKYKENSTALSKMEMEIAKAEIYGSNNLEGLQKQKENLLVARKNILAEISITEDMLTPQFTGKKCQDTGYLKSGKPCDCYLQGNK